MKFIIERDSVCMGDDANAPHRVELDLDNPLKNNDDLHKLIVEILTKYHLASVTGKKCWFCSINDVYVAKIVVQDNKKTIELVTEIDVTFLKTNKVYFANELLNSPDDNLQADIYQLMAEYYVWGIEVDTQRDEEIQTVLKVKNITGMRRILLEYFVVGGLWFNFAPFIFDEADFTEITRGWIFSTIILYLPIFLLMFFIFAIKIAVICTLFVHLVCIAIGLIITKKRTY